jgi:predicted outer membrane repeat protein
MKLKKIFPILIICLVLICSINAISAISDENDVIGSNQSDDLISECDDQQLSITDSDTLTTTQQETTLQATADESSAVQSATAQTLSPYQQFSNDLNSGQGTVYLNGDIQISKPFEIRHNVVIDGNSHSIDGQSKTNIFRVYSSTLTLKNIILKNGHAVQGGAIYCLYGNLNIDGCTFLSNVANEGGAIYQSHGSLIVTNSHFQSNKVESSKYRGHGGAIYFYNGHSKITKSTFKSNSCIAKSLKKHSKATKYQFSGGAIYFNEGSTHEVSECTFQGNKASNHGGAIYAYKPKNLKINKCTFKKNRVVFEDGGAITFNGKKLSITNSNFYNNKAYEDGGVMDALSLTKQKTRISISGCTFQGNIANKGGGVFWMGKKTVFTMKNSKFIKNKATIAGVFNAEDTNAKISKCVFQGNKATKVTSWKMKAKNGHVLKHTGGVIMMNKKVVKFIKCTFKSNSATFGGVAYHKTGKLTFTGCKYAANKAKSGPKVKKE